MVLVEDDEVVNDGGAGGVVAEDAVDEALDEGGGGGVPVDGTFD